jgi:ORF6N domain
MPGSVGWSIRMRVSHLPTPMASLLLPTQRAAHPMKKHAPIVPTDAVESRILSIRGQKVILDSDLAAIYGVETKALNRAIKRNAKRFPPDFIFQLTRAEVENLRCQTGTSSLAYGGRRYWPYAFTENGAVMAASVLNSPSAVRMSVFVVRAFAQIAAQGAPALEPLHCVSGPCLPA